jgi:hypothetical protein
MSVSLFLALSLSLSLSLSVPLCMSHINPAQRLSTHVLVAASTHATVEELLDAPFHVRSVPYQRTLGHCMFPESSCVS